MKNGANTRPKIRDFIGIIEALGGPIPAAKVMRCKEGNVRVMLVRDVIPHEFHGRALAGLAPADRRGLNRDVLDRWWTRRIRGR